MNLRPPRFHFAVSAEQSSIEEGRRPFRPRLWRGWLRWLIPGVLACAGGMFAEIGALAQSSVILIWAPSTSPNLAGYKVYYGVASNTYTNINAVGNVTNATVSGLRQGTTYFFAATVTDSSGLESDFSNEVSYTVPTNSGPQTLPVPWRTLDIGSVGLAGSATVTNGAYTVDGAGNLSGSTDEFRFLYQDLSSDGEIRCQLASVQNTGSGGCVGVMMREALTTGSRYALMGMTPTGTLRAQRRVKTSGSTTSTKAGTATLPNTWVRLVRTGDTISCYKSTDSTAWTLVTSSRVTMATNIYAGLAVASGSATALNISVFTNVTVIP